MSTPTIHNSRLFVAIAGAVAFAAACTTPPDGGGKSSGCGTGPACPGGEICLSDSCAQLCNDNNDCGSGRLCRPEGYCITVGTAASPVISAIDSDGPADGIAPYGPHRIGSELIITGSNLSEAKVDLVANSAGNASFTDLVISQSAVARLAVVLPVELENQPAELAYTVVVYNAAGSDQGTVTLLRGADGTSLTGDEIIARIAAARANGASLTADAVGSYDEAAIAALANSGGGGGGGGRLEEICDGLVQEGVCIKSQDLSSTSQWNAAVNACVFASADLCTSSQYAAIRSLNLVVGAAHPLYDSRPVWTSDYSDNDGDVRGWLLFTPNDPASSDTYGYACCQNIAPEPFRSRAALYQPNVASPTGKGVLVTYVHAAADTSFPVAASACASVGADICSKSEYVVLNDNSVFGSTVPTLPLWSNDQSDSDAAAFDPILGSAVADNNAWNSAFGYACCAAQRPLDGSCPGTMITTGQGGVCTTAIHNVADTTFYTAARNCANQGADLCSKSQMQALRNFGQFSVGSWTEDGGDNDGGTSGGLLPSQPDNPVPDTTLLGYACCL